MMRKKFLSIAALAMAGCSPSPLYIDRAPIRTAGEIPRDAQGQPIWSAIPPAPAKPTAPQ
jgi:hypothetical protein